MLPRGVVGGVTRGGGGKCPPTPEETVVAAA